MVLLTEDVVEFEDSGTRVDEVTKRDSVIYIWQGAISILLSHGEDFISRRMARGW